MRVDVVVVADGDPSGLARSAGLGSGSHRRSLAIDVDLPISPAIRADTSVLTFDVPGGYAWYFPKGDHSNVGAIHDLSAARRASASIPLAQSLAGFATRLGLDVSDGKLRGHRIPHGLSIDGLATRRILLAGDAAATADPMFGEGIAFALFSGRLAAQTIADMDAGRTSDLTSYEERIRRTLGPAMRWLGLTAAITLRSPVLAVTALGCSRRLREYAVECVAGLRHPFELDVASIADDRVPVDGRSGASARSS